MSINTYDPHTDPTAERPQSAGTSSFPPNSPTPSTPTDTIKLAFSNYAQLEITRRGSKPTNTRYDFEHWGTLYSWKRLVRKENQTDHVSFHLYQATNTDPDQSLAHIEPAPLGATEKLEEEDKGGWIPPCALWIGDDRVCRARNDLADVVVATGLIALVDDCVRERFDCKDKNARRLSGLPVLSRRDSGAVGDGGRSKRTFSGILGRPPLSSRGTTASACYQAASPRSMS